MRRTQKADRQKKKRNTNIIAKHKICIKYNMLLVKHFMLCVYHTYKQHKTSLFSILFCIIKSNKHSRAYPVKMYASEKLCVEEKKGKYIAIFSSQDHLGCEFIFLCPYVMNIFWRISLTKCFSFCRFLIIR